MELKAIDQAEAKKLVEFGQRGKVKAMVESFVKSGKQVMEVVGAKYYITATASPWGKKYGVIVCKRNGRTLIMKRSFYDQIKEGNRLKRL